MQIWMVKGNGKGDTGEEIMSQSVQGQSYLFAEVIQKEKDFPQSSDYHKYLQYI